MALTSDILERDAMERHAATEFRFLVTDAGASVAREPDASRTVLAYLMAEAFVEVELDWQEGAVFVLVARAVDGGRPGGYYVDHRGRKVRWHLVRAVDHSSRPGAADVAADLRRVTRGSGRDAMVGQIDALAAALRQVLPELPTLVQQLNRTRSAMPGARVA
ncbi:hypothetical protein GA0074695_4143 [Micromonospora viridifaciens]|uniref:Uncharacterized protein n=1 Tax=Micromonospora viridifaciens TaxID=1881 RepID=A0A1C4YEH9_MICVI|nr:hypothetical protein GA0074695_4143 [Micromonospora viridifaciens]